MKVKNLKINAILNVIKTISSIAFPLITYPYISRVLHPDHVGKVNFGSSFVSYFSLIASLGIATYAIRECSAHRDDREKLSDLSSQIFSINAITTVVAYALLFLTLAFFRRFDAYRELIIIQSTVIVFTTLGCDWLNSAMEDFLFITIRSIIFQFVSLVLMFLFVKTKEDYLIYALISVLSNSGSNITNIVYRRKFCTVRFTTKIDWKRHFKPILLLFVMLLAQTVFNSSDITMLGLMKGDFEVGLYSTAVKMSNLVSQVVSSLAWVVMPRMALYFAQGDYDVINKMLKKVLSVLITLGFPCAIGCMMLSEEIILVIAGAEYLDAKLALCILMICFMFSLVGGSFLGNMVLLPSKREGLYMKICCISTAANLVLNYFLIPVWGVNAAASTTAFSAVIILVLLLLTKDKRIKIDYLFEIFFAPCIGVFAIVAICCLVKWIAYDLFARILLSVGLSCVAYCCIQIIFKNAIVLQLLTPIRKRLHR